MELTEIKQQLTIARVLHYYGLKPDKNMRLHCPFHQDKTPSMQVYYKTNTCYCFSSRCPTHGNSMDVIDFILHKENCTKAEAIQKAVALISHAAPATTDSSIGEAPTLVKPDISREQFLQSIFMYFRNALHNSKPSRDYLKTLPPALVRVPTNRNDRTSLPWFVSPRTGMVASLGGSKYSSKATMFGVALLLVEDFTFTAVL